MYLHSLTVLLTLPCNIFLFSPSCNCIPFEEFSSDTSILNLYGQRKSPLYTCLYILLLSYLPFYATFCYIATTTSTDMDGTNLGPAGIILLSIKVSAPLFSISLYIPHPYPSTLLTHIPIRSHLYRAQKQELMGIQNVPGANNFASPRYGGP